MKKEVLSLVKWSVMIAFMMQLVAFLAFVLPISNHRNEGGAYTFVVIAGLTQTLLTSYILWGMLIRKGYDTPLPMWQKLGITIPTVLAAGWALCFCFWTYLPLQQILN